STGDGGWSATSVAISGNQDAVGGRDNVLRVACNSTGTSDIPRASATIIPDTFLNKNGQIEIWLYVPSSNTKVAGFRVTNSAGQPIFSTGGIYNLKPAATDTWEKFVLVGNMSGLTTGLRFYPINSSDVREQVTGESVYVDGVKGIVTG